ncbi:hypothetical protein NW754_000040 [Fusarium falciforme]|nr:hypothetical protein NW754_000040 [Fusarium falciforme]
MSTSLPKSEYLRLASALENRKTLSHVLPASHSVRKGLYDTIRDVWFDDVDLFEYLHADVIFTIPDRITGYKVFDIPEGIQKEAASAGEEQDNCVRQDVHNAVVFRFSWTPRLSIVVRHVYDELVRSPSTGNVKKDAD